MEVVRAGSWAPSGMNNQPWRFVIVETPPVRMSLAALTKYGKVIEGAPVAIAVFVDRAAMYHEVKDHQAVGACIENMLLAAHGLGLGAVWLGEILKRAGDVRSLLGVDPGMDLMAVVALGHPVRRKRTAQRKDTGDLVLKIL